MPPRNQQYLHTMYLFGLFIKCPFREAVTGCPFGSIRSLQSLDLKFRLAERIALHPQCSEDARHAHEACYRTRIRQRIEARPGGATGETEPRSLLRRAPGTQEKKTVRQEALQQPGCT